MISKKKAKKSDGDNEVEIEKADGRKFKKISNTMEYLHLIYKLFFPW